MALEDLVNEEKAKALAIGVGAALLAPLAIGVLATGGRPLLKSALKTGLILYEKGLEHAETLVETLDDLIAETRAEVDEELMAAATDSAVQAHDTDAEKPAAETVTAAAPRAIQGGGAK